jgi:two-component system sensor histidine kinase HydH
MDGRVLATTLAAEDRAALSALLTHSELPKSLQLGTEEYVALPRPLAATEGAASGSASGPIVIILRSRTQEILLLKTLRNYLAGTAVVAVLLATLLSFAVARTITRPLAAITDAMHDIAATGDLTRKIAVLHGSRWDDEDARLLATTFNAMTDSIARFQREANQRERLSSLGRLSTVIAHEIRNPLMIIKTSLRSLRREETAPAQVQSAARDIDEEITRLNRIVSEVLDFARPIRFELDSTDANALVADAVRAAAATAPQVPVSMDLDPGVGPITTDAGRLRQVLDNVIGNAIHALDGRPIPAGAPIRVQTTRLDIQRFLILVSDKGAGIAAEDLPRVFDPFFTTRRTGTGIGLAISRNIIEGLGGRITVASTRDRGTDVRIELPVDSRSA